MPMKPKIFSLLFALFLGVMPAFGQRKLRNQPKFDRQTLHFGFCLGLNYNNFYLETNDLTQIPGYYGVRSELNPGYSIGIISDLRLHENLSLRFIPAYASTIRNLYFDVDDPFTGERGEVLREVESAFIEAPFELKFRGDRIDNYRWYLLGGVKYTHDLASKEDSEDDDFFKITTADFGYELGIGIDFYFEYFKFSPQIKATFGMRNLLVQDGTFFVEGLEAVKTRCVLINFTFE